MNDGHRFGSNDLAVFRGSVRYCILLNMGSERHPKILLDRRVATQPEVPPVLIRPDRLRRGANLVLALLVFAGIGLRVAVYLQNRSLWNDECALAINLVSRSVGGLLLPLGLGQAAPVGFLMAEKAAIAVFGSGELALRLVPLLAGCATLIAGAWAAKRYLRAAHGLAFTAVLCLSPKLIYYSSEVKQYGPDALVALLMCLLTVAVLSRSVRLWTWALLTGGLLWFSHPAIFVAVPCCAAVLFRAGRREAVKTMLACTAVGASFALNYLLFCKSTQQSVYLHQFWKDYLGVDGSALEQCRWTAKVAAEAAVDGFSFAAWQLAACLLIAGVIAMALARRWTALLLALGPVLLALLASYLGLYPFYGRFLLFAIPGIALLVSGGLSYSGKGRWLVRIAAAFALAWAMIPVAKPVPTLDYPPIMPTSFRDVATYVQQKSTPGETLYVMGPAHMLFDYYRTQLDFSRLDIREVDLIPGAHQKAGHIIRMEGQEKFWVLVGNFIPQHAKTGPQLLRALDRIAERVDSFSAGDAEVVQFARRAETSPREPSAAKVTAPTTRPASK